MPSYETYGNSGKARCELFGEYLVENKATVRQTAKYFGMSKSTVHKDVTSKLRYEILFYSKRSTRFCRKIRQRDTFVVAKQQREDTKMSI